MKKTIKPILHEIGTNIMLVSTVYIFAVLTITVLKGDSPDSNTIGLKTATTTAIVGVIIFLCGYIFKGYSPLYYFIGGMFTTMLIYIFLILFTASVLALIFITIWSNILQEILIHYYLIPAILGLATIYYATLGLLYYDE